MWHDLRYTVRGLVKHPGFLAGGILVLALGSGLNTAIFSVVNAILYRPLPVRAPDELRYVYTVSSLSLNRTPVGMLAYRHFLALRDERDVFADVLLIGTLRERIRVGPVVDRGQGEMVSSNYFDLLGVQPFIGRGFDWTEHETTTGERVAVISHDLWRTRFLGDPDVLGKTIDLSGQAWSGAGSYAPYRSHTIVGVMPPEFRGVLSTWDSTQYWVPFLRQAADLADAERLARPGSSVRPPTDRAGLPVVRLRPGVSAELAAARVRDFGEEVRREVAPTTPDWSLQLFESRRVRLPFDPRGQIVPGRLAAAVLCLSGIVLLIAAANLAGTLLAKGVARRSELALKLTLGASRGRIVRQLVAESLLLSAAGAALGLICARWLIDLFIAATPSRFVRWQISTLVLDVPIDWRVVLFTSLSSLVTGVVVGLAPARQVLTLDLVASLAGQSVSATTAVKATLQRWIVVPQICLALVLLLLAGVTARTLIRDHARHPGYDADDIILIDFETPDRPAPLVWTKEIADRVRTERLARIERVLDRASAAPGISDVTVGMTSPLMSVPLPSMNAWVAAREGFRGDGRHYWTSRMDVTPGYFGTLRIPLLRGRLFDAGDRRHAPPVAIVSEHLARWMWPNADPIGQYLAHHTPDSSYPPQWLEVVGVVGNVHLPLADANWSPTFYTPMEQGIMDFASTVAARGDGAATDLLRTLEAAITAADPQAVPVNQRLMRDGIGELLYPRRVAAMTLASAGAIGLVLASTGLYGLISYSVAQRVREIGVRMALGAERGDVLRLILREGLILSGAGIGLGLPLTFAAIRIFSRLVAPLPSMDLVTFCAVPTLLGVVVLVACYIPALRAATVDPMDVLRGL